MWCFSLCYGSLVPIVTKLQECKHWTLNTLWLRLMAATKSDNPCQQPQTRAGGRGRHPKASPENFVPESESCEIELGAWLSFKGWTIYFHQINLIQLILLTTPRYNPKTGFHRSKLILLINCHFKSWVWLKSLTMNIKTLPVYSKWWRSLSTVVSL